MNRDEFQAHYESQFNEFPCKSEAEAALWWRFVDQIPESMGIRLFEAVVGDLAESSAMPGVKPRLREFEKALRRLQGKAGAPRHPTPEACSLCDYTGFISVPAAQVRDDAGVRWVFGQTPGVVLSRYASPCRCGLGNLHHRQSGLPQSVVDEARATLLDYRQAAGHRTEGASISREEFLEHAEEFGCSVQGIMHDIVIQSHIDAGMAPADLLERQHAKRGETVKALRAAAQRKARPQDASVPPQSDGSWHLAGDVAQEVVADARRQEEQRAEDSDTSFSFGANAEAPEEKKSEEAETTYGYRHDSLPF
jgi:hypothetical protein